MKLAKFEILCITTKTCTQIFKRNFLENYNDSEHAVKTKNAPFFMNFLPNINKNGNFFPTRLVLSSTLVLHFASFNCHFLFVYLIEL